MPRPDPPSRKRRTLCHERHLVAGIPAFPTIWQRLPGFRWLAWLPGQPLVGRLAAQAYEGLAFALYRWDRHRRRRLSPARS